MLEFVLNAVGRHTQAVEDSEAWNDLLSRVLLFGTSPSDFDYSVYQERYMDTTLEYEWEDEHEYDSLSGSGTDSGTDSGSDGEVDEYAEAVDGIDNDGTLVLVIACAELSSVNPALTASQCESTRCSRI